MAWMTRWTTLKVLGSKSVGPSSSAMMRKLSASIASGAYLHDGALHFFSPRVSRPAGPDKFHRHLRVEAEMEMQVSAQHIVMAIAFAAVVAVNTAVHRVDPFNMIRHASIIE